MMRCPKDRRQPVFRFRRPPRTAGSSRWLHGLSRRALFGRVDDDRSSRPRHSPSQTPATVERHVLRRAPAHGLGAAVDRRRDRRRALDRPRDLAPPRPLARSRRRRARRSFASSGRARAICFRWTPSASRASPGPVIASPAIATAPAPRSACGSAGSSVTRSSTTTPGSPTANFTRRARRHRRRLPRARPGLLRRPRHQAAAAADRQRLDLHPQQRASPRCSPPHGIRHRTIPPRTPKRNGKVERYQQTLAREWASASATAQAPPERPRCHTGSTTTTAADPTPKSATDHPSAALPTSQGRTSRFPTSTPGRPRRAPWATSS